MTPRHAADRVTARVRAWWTERRDRRDAAEDEAAAEDEEFWASIVADGDEEWLRPPWEFTPQPGQRYQGPPAQPGDIPDQPTGEGR
jgi:hypothetical protein